MSPWDKGRSVVEEYLESGELQRLQGEQANGDILLDQATKTLSSALAVQEDDPRTAVVLAYDAARCAAEGLLAEQGLRAKGRGGGAEGHHAIVAAVARAQFGHHFSVLDDWRRRRNDLSYPSRLNVVDRAEAADAIADAHDVVAAAQQLYESGALSVWR